MKRSIPELQRAFKARIHTLENNLKQAEQEELGSEERNDAIAQIAVVLRTMFCTSQSQPLIKSANMERTLFFPMQDLEAPFNELSYFLLAGREFFKEGECFFKSFMLLRDDMVPRVIMSYKSWLSEAVIDLKLEGFPPMTRRDIIKIVADKTGAHVDTDLHPLMGTIEPANKWQLTVAIDLDGEKFASGNLLYETVLSIGKEVMYAWRFLNNPKLFKREPDNDFQLVIYDYPDEKAKRYKYAVCTPKVNTYNTTRYYPCNITKHPVQTYYMQVKNRVFPVSMFCVEDYGM